MKQVMRSKHKIRLLDYEVVSHVVTNDNHLVTIDNYYKNCDIMVYTCSVCIVPNMEKEMGLIN